MHIPDGFIPISQCLIYYVILIVALYFSVKWARTNLDEKRIPLLAVLAAGIANVLGKIYVILAPFVGMLGTFMTGSNMSSNILFGGFQVTTANLLGVEAAPVLGAQSAGGAIGSAISPSKIILGTTTANILGSEGEVLKKLMALAIICAIAIGFIAFVFVAL